ncbi:Gfo/Idh/MocA family oxidoreductase [Neobacillus rhizosphaerae]|uniref:Gfo/Idh/MocA family protein n=1 Tax=Neobacillus rhizosphaerae TaxID=2880965 RepID=UPI003D2BD547
MLSKLGKGINKINIVAKRTKVKLQRTKQQNPIHWGIIGLGTMAHSFSNALELVPDASIIAVASRTKEKAKSFAGKHNIPNSYGNYEEMLSATDIKLDVIYIATPTKYHYEHIKMCLENGYSVLCEKPITTNAKELSDLMSIAREKKLFLMEGMWMKCLPTYQKGLQWAQEGKIGNVQWIRVDLSKNEVVNKDKTTFIKEEGGGVLLDYGIYATAFPIDFLGKTVEISQCYKNLRESGIDRDWFFVIESEDKKAFVSISSGYQGDRKAVVIGDKGTIEWTAQFNRTNCINRFDQKGEMVESFKTNYLYDGFEYEIQEVHKCLREGKVESSLVPLEKSLITLELVDDLWYKAR